MLPLLRPYKGWIGMLLVCTLAGNLLNLAIPKIIANGIDAYSKGAFHLKATTWLFAGTAAGVFLFTFFQNILQTYVSEKVARDLRGRLNDTISLQSYRYIQQVGSARLLTNLTSDIDSIKMFVSQAIVSISSSVLIIAGTSVMLFWINARLAAAVMLIIPIIGGTFYLVLKKVRSLFKVSREIIDWLNKVINESILGAALIRVVNAQIPEYEKFLQANGKARSLGLSILRLFATLIPVISLTANLAVLTVLLLGGHYVMQGSMTLGDFAAFNSYISLLIFPIIIIGFMSNIIAQASASYDRVRAVLHAENTEPGGNLVRQLDGSIQVSHVSLELDGKPILKDLSFEIPAGSRTAIIGPTAAGKTQLLYLLCGLAAPSSGRVCYDGIELREYRQESLLEQLGFVFQDSVLFQMSLKDNIVFNRPVSPDALEEAVRHAELDAFVRELPDGWDTEVSERGSSLSGGQKQRVMLARALAMRPKILLLDDFTARVDASTEQRIWKSLAEKYPGMTQISVTQKMASVTDFDQILFLMEGELIASGTHEQLIASCPEYIQIYQSQRSTSHYELQPE